jgi:signal transduction histidine kinase
MRWRPIDGFRALPLRIQLTVVNTAAVLAGLLLVLAAARSGVRVALFNEAGDVLLGEVRATALALNEAYPDTAQVVAELRRKATGHVDRGWFVHLVRCDRDTVWKSPTCPDYIVSRPVDESRAEAVVSGGGYVWARRRITDPAATPFYVRIGMPRSKIDERVSAVTSLLVPIGLVVALCTPLAGYWLALRATRPLAHILEVADSLSPTTLGDRLHLQGSGDELDRLAAKINRLLDDVAHHVDRQEQFVADAAHEIRGPLTAIQSTLEVAATKERTENEYRRTIEDVLTESRHLSKLANNLLLLTEATSASPTPSPAAIDIAPVVQATVGMFSVVAEDRSIELVADVAGPCAVRVEPGDIRQVVANLVDNAIRFTAPGGAVRVALRVGSSGLACGLAITDNGIGVDARHLPFIFDRFYQVDPARDRSDARRGGGLGLAICRSIVNRYGGSITMSSRPGIGTSVVVSLPIVKAARQSGHHDLTDRLEVAAAGTP